MAENDIFEDPAIFRQVQEIEAVLLEIQINEDFFDLCEVILNGSLSDTLPNYDSPIECLNVSVNVGLSRVGIRSIVPALEKFSHWLDGVRIRIEKRGELAQEMMSIGLKLLVTPN